jgi:hypothetical protein
MSFHVPNKWRVREGRLASDDSYGNNGMFILPQSAAHQRPKLTVIASDGGGWQHVSVSTPFRTPTWEEMCLVKGIFWDAEDTVLQYHPPESEYVNNHPYCLHLWRPTEQSIPLPPSFMVGLKGASRDEIKAYAEAKYGA